MDSLKGSLKGSPKGSVKGSLKGSRKGSTVEARKLEHHSPPALKVEYIGDPSTNPPKPMFQLSGVHCIANLGFRVGTSV